MTTKTSLSQLIVKIFIFFTVAFLWFTYHSMRPGNSLPTLKIGFVAPFEGLHRPLGYEMLFGVKLALQERNLAGGLHGYPVELVALNDFDDPTEAQVQARTLAADPDVWGVVGHLSAATTLAAKPIYQQAHLAVSVPWTVDLAHLPLNQRGLVMVAASYSETSARLHAITQQAHFNNVIELRNSDIPAIPANTQAVQLVADGVTAGEAILALHQADISMPIFGQVNVGSPQVVQIAKAAANGLIFVSPGPDPRDVPGAKTFINRYQTLAGFPPGPRAVLAYDATHVLLDAIEQAMLLEPHHPNRATVGAVITHIQRQGISGLIAFDEQGRRVNAPVWVYQISGEKYPGTLIAS